MISTTAQRYWQIGGGALGAKPPKNVLNLLIQYYQCKALAPPDLKRYFHQHL